MNIVLLCNIMLLQQVKYKFNINNIMLRQQVHKKNTSLKSIHQITAILNQKLKKVKSQYKIRQFQNKQYDIRENQLNSMFLNRKRRLQNISKQNKNIYTKINTQKSKYAKEQLNQSYRSSAKISHRLSTLMAKNRQNQFSKLSRANSATSRKSNGFWGKPKQRLILEQISVKKIDNNNIDNIKMLFNNKENKMKEKKIGDDKLPILERKRVFEQEKDYRFFNIRQVQEQKNKNKKKGNLMNRMVIQGRYKQGQIIKHRLKTLLKN